MGNVVIDMSMSLDGYIAAPNDNPDQGLGEDGMRLHKWAFDDPSVFEVRPEHQLAVGERPPIDALADPGQGREIGIEPTDELGRSVRRAMLGHPAAETFALAHVVILAARDRATGRFGARACGNVP